MASCEEGVVRKVRLARSGLVLTVVGIPERTGPGGRGGTGAE